MSATKVLLIGGILSMLAAPAVAAPTEASRQALVAHRLATAGRKDFPKPVHTGNVGRMLGGWAAQQPLQILEAMYGKGSLEVALTSKGGLVRWSFVNARTGKPETLPLGRLTRWNGEELFVPSRRALEVRNRLFGEALIRGIESASEKPPKAWGTGVRLEYGSDGMRWAESVSYDPRLRPHRPDFGGGQDLVGPAARAGLPEVLKPALAPAPGTKSLPVTSASPAVALWTAAFLAGDRKREGVRLPEPVTLSWKTGPERLVTLRMTEDSARWAAERLEKGRLTRAQLRRWREAEKARGPRGEDALVVAGLLGKIKTAEGQLVTESLIPILGMGHLQYRQHGGVTDVRWRSPRGKKVVVLGQLAKAEPRSAPTFRPHEATQEQIRARLGGILFSAVLARAEKSHAKLVYAERMGAMLGRSPDDLTLDLGGRAFREVPRQGSTSYNHAFELLSPALRPLVEAAGAQGALPSLKYTRPYLLVQNRFGYLEKVPVPRGWTVTQRLSVTGQGTVTIDATIDDPRAKSPRPRIVSSMSNGVVELADGSFARRIGGEAPRLQAITAAEAGLLGPRPGRSPRP